jgi:hypothetical protein
VRAARDQGWTHVDRLLHQYVVRTNRVVVTGIHYSCKAKDIWDSVVSTLREALLPFDEEDLRKGFGDHALFEVGAGVKCLEVTLTEEIEFSTAADSDYWVTTSLLSDSVPVRYGKAKRLTNECLLLMVSPMPEGIRDVKSPAMVIRGMTGSDSMDGAIIRGIDWMLNGTLPVETGEIFYIRTHIQIPTLVYPQGTTEYGRLSKDQILTRAGHETVLLVYTRGSVGQTSVWSWMLQHNAMRVRRYTGERSRGVYLSVQENGTNVDIWEGVRAIASSGFEHITAGKEVVGNRLVTLVSAREGPPEDVNLYQSIRGWESQGVDLANVGMCAWISGERERGKQRRIYNVPSHVLLVGIQSRIWEVPYMEDFADMELETSFRDCLTGMWKARMGDPPQLVSLYPGSIKTSLSNIRTIKSVESRVMFYPRLSTIMRDLLREGWAHPLNGEEVIGALGETSVMESLPNRSLGLPTGTGESNMMSYRTMLLQGDRAPSETTSRDSGSTWREPGEVEPWRQVIEEMKQSQESLASRVQGLEGSMHQVERDTARMSEELKETSEVLRELREDSRRLTALELQSSSTNSAVMRMEEMMMRMLMGGGQSVKRTKIDEIENEIATMKLTNQDLRHTVSDRLSITHTETRND